MEPIPFTREQLISGLQNKQFRKIAFLVGAGISVAAGIPDFRTPKIGLYAQVKAMGLPVPEDIFSLEYFLDDPIPFYTIAREFLFTSEEIHPVHAHYFMKMIEERKQLAMIYTQNIDGLELTAGISMKKVVQAHGHMRSAHCISCKAEYSMKEFESFFSQSGSSGGNIQSNSGFGEVCTSSDTGTGGGKILFCNKCHEKEFLQEQGKLKEITNNVQDNRDTSQSSSSFSLSKDKQDDEILQEGTASLIRTLPRSYRSDEGGIIKPDIIFFGEKVSKSFHRQFAKISEADLVIVMGTSLKVHPFSHLLKSIDVNTPLVIINKELPKIVRPNVLFLEGDIETTIESLAKELEWILPNEMKEMLPKTTSPRKRKSAGQAIDKQQIKKSKLTKVDLLEDPI